MTPSTTMGEVSSNSLTSVWKIHATCKLLDVAAIDLFGGMKARLGIVAVGQQKTSCVLCLPS